MLASLIHALTITSFDLSRKRRMAKFAEHFPDAATVSTLSRQLSWIPMGAIVWLKTPQVRQFYVSQAAANTWRLLGLCQGHEKADPETAILCVESGREQAELLQCSKTASPWPNTLRKEGWKSACSAQKTFAKRY
jgi:hypothetical protein